MAIGGRRHDRLLAEVAAAVPHVPLPQVPLVQVDQGHDKPAGWIRVRGGSTTKFEESGIDSLTL